MIGKLAEPTLTRRLALLAEARRDDPRVSQHLIEAKAEIGGCKRRYWALPRLHASRPPHILCATLLTPLCGRNSETPPVRACTDWPPLSGPGGMLV